MSTLERKEIDEYVLLHKRKIGLQVIGNIYKVSKQTIKNRMVQHGLYEKVRKFDTKNRHIDTTHNAHYPVNFCTHFIDGYRINNGSIDKKHHSRKNLEGTPLLIGLTNRKEIVHFEIFQVVKETQQKYMITIDNALRKGINIKVLCMDRYYKKLTKQLKDKGIIVVVYGKDFTRPYNSQIEQKFSNISKTIYEDMEFIKGLDSEDLREYFKGLCEVYFYYKATKILKFLRKEKRIKVPQIIRR